MNDGDGVRSSKKERKERWRIKIFHGGKFGCDLVHEESSIIAQDGVSRDNDTIGRLITNYLPLDPFLPRSEPSKPRTWTRLRGEKSYRRFFFLFFCLLVSTKTGAVVKRLNGSRRLVEKTDPEFIDDFAINSRKHVLVIAVWSPSPRFFALHAVFFLTSKRMWIAFLYYINK